MPIIGVRELREKTPEILRKLREERAEYVVTHQGKPIALLIPVREEAMERAMLEAGRRERSGSWDAYAEAAGKMRSAWPAETSSAAVLDGLRR